MNFFSPQALIIVTFPVWWGEAMVWKQKSQVSKLKGPASLHKTVLHFFVCSSRESWEIVSSLDPVRLSHFLFKSQWNLEVICLYFHFCQGTFKAI